VSARSQISPPRVVPRTNPPAQTSPPRISPPRTNPTSFASPSSSSVSGPTRPEVVEHRQVGAVQDVASNHRSPLGVGRAHEVVPRSQLDEEGPKLDPLRQSRIPSAKLRPVTRQEHQEPVKQVAGLFLGI